MPSNIPELSGFRSDRELPSGRPLDLSLPSATDGTDAIPRFEVEEPGVLPTRPVDTSVPELSGIHTHLLFLGSEFEQMSRPIREGVITPDKVVVLLIPREDHREARDQISEVTSAPIEFREMDASTTGERLFVEAYEMLDDYLDTDESQQNHLSINLTAESSLVEQFFFTSVSTYVLEHPSCRSSIKIYHAPRNVSASPRDSYSEEESTDTDFSQLSTAPELLFQYVSHDLSERCGQLENTWKEIVETREIPTKTKQGISSALRDLNTAVDQLGSDTRPNLVHELEDAVWLLADYADDIDTDSNSTPVSQPVTTFRVKLAQLEESVTQLRDVVRNNRRIFGQDRPMQSAMAKNQQQSTINRIFPDAELTGVEERSGIEGVYQIPLPLERKSHGAQEDEIQQKILQLIDHEGEFSSISELARSLAGRLEESYNASFRSKVQYNVRTLAEKGYVIREPNGRSHRVRLSLLGQAWMQAHDLRND